MKKIFVFLGSLLMMGTVPTHAQFYPYKQYTLLPKYVMDEIIGEASGEMAMNHMIEMAGYNRGREKSEFESTFYEATYTLQKLDEYGIPEARIERFPGRQSWDGIRGELWEISPNSSKIADYDDLKAVLASGSQNADIEAELVWVGEGIESDFEGLDLTGKIAVTSGSLYLANRYAMDKGAEGLITVSGIRAQRDPLQIPWSGIRGNNAKFAFNLNAREGTLLKERLLRGEKIKVHAVVESAMRDYDLQDITAVIPGTDPDAGEVILTAHIFEGYTKMGANDDISGCAAILDVARTLKTLIDEKRIPRPKRSIRFLWIPEFSGTGPWVNAHQDLMEKTLCNINLDMVGLWLSQSQSHMCLMRTTYGNPHYINDVMENYYRYVGETNRETLHNRSFTKRIVAPSGSDEPFYYKIETHYGASDHEVFNDWGIQVPGIMMITWPDFYYHTSEDRPYHSDPTQLKRTIVIAASAAYTIAGAEDAMAMKVAGETFSNAGTRMGHQVARALDELNETDSENFLPVYKQSLGYIDAVVMNEKETLESVLELAPENTDLEAFIVTLQNALDEKGSINRNVVQAHASRVANNLEMVIPEVIQTDLEIMASQVVPRVTPMVKEKGYMGHMQIIRNLPTEKTEAYPIDGLADSRECARLINGRHTALDIKKLLDTQSRETSDLQAILNYLEILEMAGLITK